MKNKLLGLLKTKPFVYTLLVLIILSQLVYISYGFQTQKKGFHSDELYSYGLSNSHENPFLTLGSAIGSDEDYIYVNEWISGSIVKDYIVVNDGEAFDYANVWYNQSLDRHPPLYYAVLHTVCSFFPNQFSPWFGFSINLVCFAVTQLFLFLIAKKLLKSNWLALLVCLCYGFSAGAVNTAVFIRMYCMTAMWVVILTYLHLRLKECGDNLKLPALIPLLIITTLGALTQHEFTIAAYAFALCFCLHYLMNKKYKSFFKYGFTMLFGVLLSWAIFPAMPKQIFSEGGNAASFRAMGVQIMDTLNYVFGELFGLSGIGAITAACVLVLLIAAALIIRHKKKAENSESKTASDSPKQSSILRFAKWLGGLDVFYIGTVAAVLFVIITAIHSVNFEYMGYCDRYLFVTYPLIVLLIIALVSYLVREILPEKKLIFKRAIPAVLFSLLLIINMALVVPEYYFPRCDFDDLKAKLDGNNVIILENMESLLGRLICFSSCAMDCDNVYYGYYRYPIENLETLDDIETDKPVYILLMASRSLDDEIFEPFKELNFYETPEFLGTYEVHGYNYKLYVMK